jgi:acyl carrier protein
MPDLSDRVRQIIVDHFASVRHVDAEHIDHSRVVPDTRMVEDLGADSLDLAEIVFSLEDHFGCEIGEDEVARVITVGDIVALIQHRPDSD